MNAREISSYVFIDIETVPGSPELGAAGEAMSELWAEKHKYFHTQAEQSPEESYRERAGIYAEFGKIVCIGLGYFLKKPQEGKTFALKAFYGEDERELLLNFKTALEALMKRGEIILCGHNIREFDVPYLCRRMIIQSVELPGILQLSGKKPWEVPLADSMQLWKFGDYKHYTSLRLLAEILGLPSPKQDMDGRDVSRVYYQEKDLERIAAYCRRDVVTTARVFQRMNHLDPLPEENILEF